MKIASIFFLLVVVSTTAGQITPDDSTLTDKSNYKGTIFLGRGGNFTNLGASIRMKPPAFLKEYDADPYLSIVYLFGESYDNEDHYFEGLAVALEFHKKLNTSYKAFDLVTFVGAGLPLPGGAPDPDEEQPKGLNYLLTGGLKVQRSMIELNARAGLLRSWPLPNPTPFLTLNVGVRTKSLLFPLGDVFRRKSKAVDQTPQENKYRWGSSFGGAFFEDKFNHLETVKVFYRLREPRILNRPNVRQHIALGFLWGEHFPEEDGPISSTNFFYTA